MTEDQKTDAARAETKRKASEVSEVEIQRLANRTPEEKARDREQLEREVAAEMARHPDGYPLPDRRREEINESVEELAARVMARIRQGEVERALLACSQAIAKGHPADEDEGDVIGRDACEKAGAFTDCRFAFSQGCPRSRVNSLSEKVDLNLTRAGVGDEDRGVIMRALRRANPEPLKDIDSMRVARGVLRRELMTVVVRQAAQIRKDGSEQIGSVDLKGNERVVGFFGNPGRGKSIAAIYIIAKRGGRYVLEYDLSRPKEAGIEIRALADVPVLVIDQVGRANAGEGRFTPANVEELIARRVSAGRLTVLVGPITYRDFAPAYPDAVDRIKGYGAFVQFAGPSIR